jgi:hypothetical protein
LSLINTGLIITDKANIIIPASVGRTMLAILGLLENQGLEYGLYLKGAWDPKTLTVTIEEDTFFLPQQTVTSSTIEFSEEPPAVEWNVVIHRHPSGVNSFSGTDKNSINMEFLASIIFMPPWGFPDAIVNIPFAPGVKLQVDARITVEGSMFPEADALRERVREKIVGRRVRVPEAHSAASPPQVPGVARASSGVGKTVEGAGGSRTTFLGKDETAKSGGGLRRLPRRNSIFTLGETKDILRGSGLRPPGVRGGQQGQSDPGGFEFEDVEDEISSIFRNAQDEGRPSVYRVGGSRYRQDSDWIDRDPSLQK